METNYPGVRSFLASVRDARVELRRCEAQLEQLRSQCESTTAVLSAAPGGGGGDVHRDTLWALCAEQGEELLRRQTEYRQQIGAVEAFISRLPDARHRTILRLRYVDLLPWRAVLEEMQSYGMYYSERQMYDLHRAGLRAAKRQWNEQREDAP